MNRLHLQIAALLILFLETGVAWTKTAPRKATAPGKAPVAVNHVAFDATSSITTSRFDRFIQKVYDNADTNHDGTISLEEAYELVLKLYIYINRQAPVNPPSRTQVHRLFDVSDRNRNQRISRDEFTELASLLGQRALVRIVTCKLLTMVAAPILAEYTAQYLSDQAWLPELAARVVPERLLPVVTSENFGRTVLIVLFVSTMGKAVMNMVNVVLDWSLPPEEK